MKGISTLTLKGGSGKTITAQNLGYELNKRGYKVLEIDNDKQGNLSKAYKRYKEDGIAPITRLLNGDWESVDDLIQTTEYEGIDIITSNMSLFVATWQLTTSAAEDKCTRYKKFMGEIQDRYDYFIIDNPPDIAINVANALAITDEVIAPVKIDEYALDGLDIVNNQVEEAKQINPKIKLSGVLITSYQKTAGEEAGLNWLREKNVFDILGVIRYSKKISENTYVGMPIYEYSPLCATAQDYKKFVTKYTGKGR